MILDQADFPVNNILVDLLKKVSEVLVFMMGTGRVAEISSMPTLYGRLARQTLECADFIAHYSEIENTCESTPAPPSDTQCRLFAQCNKILFNATVKFSMISCSNSVE